jgi:hypothetical protein
MVSGLEAIGFPLGFCRLGVNGNGFVKPRDLQSAQARLNITSEATFDASSRSCSVRGGDRVKRLRHLEASSAGALLLCQHRRLFYCQLCLGSGAWRSSADRRAPIDLYLVLLAPSGADGRYTFESADRVSLNVTPDHVLLARPGERTLSCREEIAIIV